MSSNVFVKCLQCSRSKSLGYCYGCVRAFRVRAPVSGLYLASFRVTRSSDFSFSGVCV